MMVIAWAWASGTPCAPVEGTVWASHVVAFDVGAQVDAAYGDPKTAIGKPDFDRGTGAVSLGNPTKNARAEIVLGFDRMLVNGPGTDIVVFEAGPSAERTELAVSTDGETWLDVGVIEGSTNTIDLGEHLGSERFRFVRLRTAGGPTRGPWAGPDIDAVGLVNACNPSPKLAHGGAFRRLEKALR